MGRDGDHLTPVITFQSVSFTLVGGGGGGGGGGGVGVGDQLLSLEFN